MRKVQNNPQTGLDAAKMSTFLKGIWLTVQTVEYKFVDKVDSLDLELLTSSILADYCPHSQDNS